LIKAQANISVTDCSIAKIELNLNAAHLIISEATVETMSVEMEASTVNIHSPLILLQGSLKNQSLLLIEDAQEIQLKKDEKSRLNLYRYQ
jgi:flagellar assembly factor FliW